MNKQQLIQHAKDVREKAYVPYSQFPVGAAVLTELNHIYTGCNIENAAYPTTCCAERVAIFKAVSAGETSFTSIAVVADTKRPVPPCGSCRQVMSEFFTPKTKIHVANLQGEVKSLTLEQLLPYSFSPEDLTND
ncbi:cytidine deaminase [Pontibacillus litoralis]|uniref:Cytidine deaminase n=1 Tax=Pontibacillus litoralis JSM 072002 TaxID=1385512 RepID=A0A0A5HWC2_9BACI|nr:cytidine deaminase [Pontibacillus litoralis]KGX87927.1 cytidine deaminase [Pontibacillus litoralis JSM 072002]